MFFEGIFLGFRLYIIYKFKYINIDMGIRGKRAVYL